jgi:3-deoxy-D-arabino-heptulosonate 7-phosphate (DAHP) synthase class II
MADRILSALDFMRVCGVESESALKTADIFMSHEGLQLCYEEALTRPAKWPRARSGHPFRRSALGSAASASPSKSGGETPVHPPAAHPHAAAPPAAASAPASATPAPTPAQPATGPSSTGTSVPSHDPNSLYYNLGTHFLWIGDRTRQIDHGHIEYFRGIANPIGIKLGPTSDPNEIVELIKRLWPDPAGWPGKIVLISRLGAAGVRDKLPAFIRAVQAAKFASPVVWVCDPMHGNTRVTSNGFKTREFDDILAELKHTFEVHAEMGSRLGGCHFELTGENVTECTGGPEKLLEGDLPLRYTTYCDPRLNYAQGKHIELLFRYSLFNILT